MTKTQFDLIMDRLERQGLLEKNTMMDLDTLVHLIDRMIDDTRGV